MRDILKDIEEYNRLYGDIINHNGIKLEDIEQVARIYNADAIKMLQIFCNIGYMRGYRSGKRDAKKGQGKE